MTAKRIIWISAAIILTVTLIYRDKINEANHRFNVLSSKYEAKNDLAFFSFLDQTPSFLPLAETLEELSAVSDDEDPAKIQVIIERAKYKRTPWINIFLF
ncbi:hypothetical protein [Paenibacillus alkalitolerans]|uniref:hypothetical protein n=1 Tax=Paenibacillus alkalitolerans TaxID=2799335 RepID=UPI0018F53974|nr:hypothetical protein [Paenibacillus alkalitolerans]